MTGTLGCREVRNGLAGMLLAVGLAVGAAGTAGADPSVVPTPTPKPTVTVEGGAAAGASAAAAGATAAATAAAAGDVLDVLAEEYAVGSGGGQLSNLLKVSLKLRAMGFKPSKQYLDELTAAMKYRPNQNPLISALKDTIAYQQKIRAQTQILQQAQSQQNASSAVMGAGQMPGDSNPGQVPGAPVPGAGPVAPAAGAPMMPMPASTTP